jgi:hypothetical protein
VVNQAEGVFAGLRFRDRDEWAETGKLEPAQVEMPK